MPRSPSAARAAARSIWPLGVGADVDQVTPLSRNAARRAGSAERSAKTQVGTRRASAIRRAVCGTRRVAVDDDPHRRSVGRVQADGRSAAGSSATTVPVPTMIAS